MGLELVGGKNVGQEAGRGASASERLIETERLVAEARQRLGTLVDRLAQLRLRLGAPENGGSAETAGSVPALEMPSV